VEVQLALKRVRDELAAEDTPISDADEGDTESMNTPRDNMVKSLNLLSCLSLRVRCVVRLL
jgi:hypothetical protein